MPGADRRGRRLVFATGMALFMIASLACGVADRIALLDAGPPESSGLLAGANDAFRQGGIAVGVAAFGALVPAGAALGHGNVGAYVAGFHHALLVGIGIAAAGTVATAVLIGAPRARAAQTGIAAQPAPDLA